MTARSRGDKPKAHSPLGVGEAYRTTQPDMAKGARAHCVGSRRVTLLFQHAAQAITHWAHPDPIHAVTVFSCEFTEQFATDKVSGH